MTFDVSGDAYGRFMGRFSEPLAVEFANLVNPRIGQTALDVGSGPGALTAVLVERLGDDAVSAIDPSESFVEALLARFPDLDARVGVAEDLPYPKDTFNLTLAQLVVHFMSDPVAALTEMARVTKPGGTVAACVWDQGGGQGPIAAFWRAVYSLDPSYPNESERAGTHEGQLVRLFEEAELTDIHPATLAVHVEFSSFDDWWQPFTLGVGPAGAYVESLSAEEVEQLRDRCAAELRAAPLAIDAIAWTAVGHP